MTLEQAKELQQAEQLKHLGPIMEEAETIVKELDFGPQSGTLAAAVLIARRLQWINSTLVEIRNAIEYSH